jgi:hypothetical protein
MRHSRFADHDAITNFTVSGNIHNYYENVNIYFDNDI